MVRDLTCIVCPLGCSLKVELENGVVKAVSGNTCPKGKQYAENECTNPQRTVTSTMRCSDGSMVSVKTDKTIAKENMMACMRLLNQTVAKLPVCVGDVILKDVFGASIVATQNKA